MKIVHWIIRIIVFVLILVLVLNNMQKVQFNFYGIYTWDLPLIILIFAAAIIGVFIGFAIWLVRIIELKSQIRNLKKDLEKSQNKPSISGMTE